MFVVVGGWFVVGDYGVRIFSGLCLLFWGQILNGSCYIFVTFFVWGLILCFLV